MSHYVVLVADRDAVQRQLIDLLLAQDGYELVDVENGQQALEYLRNHTPDLVILGLDLPDVSGADICDKIKSVSRLSHIPVVLLAAPSDGASAKLDERTKALAQLVRADLLLQKPLGDKNLRERARRLLNPDKESYRPKRPGLKDTQDIDDTLAALVELKSNSPRLHELEEEVGMLRRDREMLKKRLASLQQEMDELRRRRAATPVPETPIVPPPTLREEQVSAEGMEIERLNGLLGQQKRQLKELKRRNKLLVEALEEEKAKGEGRGLFGFGRRRSP